MKNNDLRIIMTFFEGAVSVVVIHSRVNLKIVGNPSKMRGRPLHHYIGFKVGRRGMLGYSCSVIPHAVAV